MRWDNYERLKEQSRREFGHRSQQNTGGSSQGYNRQQNFSGARSDYDDNARTGEDRGWFDKASDEVSSWFGSDDATRRRQRDERRDGNYNEYDDNAYHSYQAGYTPKESNPFYPTTNRIYERDDRSNRSNQNYQSNRDSQSNQARGFSSIGNRGGENRQRGWRETRASDLMTENVATVNPFDTVQRAARIMRDEDCGAVPVVDRQGRMVGMVTDRDITVRLVASGSDPRYAQVQDCMTDEVFACNVNDSLDTCLRTMKEHQIRRIAVLDNQNRVVGIISQGDLARHADSNRHRGGRHEFTDMVADVSEPNRNPYS